MKDNGIMKNLTGYKPQKQQRNTTVINFVDGIKKTIEWK